MKKLLFIFMIIALITAGGCAENTHGAELGSDLEWSAKSSAQAEESERIIFFEDCDIEKVLYYDDSAPDGEPAEEYHDSEEIAKILEMLKGVVLKDERGMDDSSAAPGDFCGYELYTKDGKIQKIWRSGKYLTVNGKTFEYEGSIRCQLHKNEVVIAADCVIGYPEGGRIPLYIAAYDMEHTQISRTPVLKIMDESGSRWREVQSSTPEEEYIFASDALRYIDLEGYGIKADDIDPITGMDGKAVYTVVLPNGETQEITALFTIFSE